jgi:hypothetical protein
MLTKKSSQAKKCPIPRKWLINDYPLLICITARKYRGVYSSIITPPPWGGKESGGEKNQRVLGLGKKIKEE